MIYELDFRPIYKIVPSSSREVSKREIFEARNEMDAAESATRWALKLSFA